MKKSRNWRKKIPSQKKGRSALVTHKGIITIENAEKNKNKKLDNLNIVCTGVCMTERERCEQRRDQERQTGRKGKEKQRVTEDT